MVPLSAGAGALGGGALLRARGVELAPLVAAGGLPVLAPTLLHDVHDANRLLPVGAGLEEHLPVPERKQGEVLPRPDAGTRVHLQSVTTERTIEEEGEGRRSAVRREGVRDARARTG